MQTLTYCSEETTTKNSPEHSKLLSKRMEGTKENVRNRLSKDVDYPNKELVLLSLSLVRSKFLTVTNPTFQKWLADFGIQKELISLHSWSLSTIDTTLIPTGDTIRNYTLALDAATWFLWHSDTLTTMKKGLNYNHTMNVSVRTINITPVLCLTFEDAKEEVFAHSALFHVRALCG